MRAGALFLVPLEILYNLLKDAGAARQHAEKRHQDNAPARRKDTPGQRASTQERILFLRAGALLPFVRAGALFSVAFGNPI